MKHYKLVILATIVLMLFIAIPRAYPAAYDDVMAYLKMDGDMSDSSGKGYTGTPYGNVSYAEGVYGQAGYFDGAGDYVLLPQNPSYLSLSSSSNWAASVWVKTTDTRVDTSGTTLGNVIFGNLEGTGYLSLGIEGGKIATNIYAGGWTKTLGSIDVADGDWHHLIWMNSANTGIDMYVDSIVDGTRSVTNSGANYISVIGDYNGVHYGDGYLNGSIDDVVVWSKLLDESEREAVQSVGVEAFEFLSAGSETLTLGMTTEELAQLAQLYADGKAGLEPEAINIDGADWYYYADELDGRSYGDAWADGGYNYLYFGSGVTTDPQLGGAVPEMPPLAAQTLFFGLGGISLCFKMLKGQRVKESEKKAL